MNVIKSGIHSTFFLYDSKVLLLYHIRGAGKISKVNSCKGEKLEKKLTNVYTIKYFLLNIYAKRHKKMQK